MARLAIVGTATVIGAYFGAAPVGALAGTLIANAVLGPEGAGGADVSSEGPRLTDLAISSSASGAPINISYGTMRLNGNIIWSDGIREEVVTNTVSGGGGGKGGGAPSSSSTQTTYNYYATFAIAFGEGIATNLVRIFADGKKVFDATDDALAQKADLVFRFYRGTEDQEPDPAIEAKVGLGKTPAHRGLCYIVFEDLPLGQFGNRIPNFTAEISFDSVARNTNTIFTQPPTSILTYTPRTFNIFLDEKRGFLYTCPISASTPGQANNRGYAAIDKDVLDTRFEYARQSYEPKRSLGRIYDVGDFGYLYAITGDGRSILKIAQGSGAVVKQQDGNYYGGGGDEVDRAYDGSEVYLDTLTGRRPFLVTRDSGIPGNAPGLYSLRDGDTLDQIVTIQSPPAGASNYNGRMFTHNNRVYNMCFVQGITNEMRITEIVPSSEIIKEKFFNYITVGAHDKFALHAGSLFTFNPSDYIRQPGRYLGTVVDKRDNSFIHIYITSITSSLWTVSAIKQSIDDRSIVWSTDLDTLAVNTVTTSPSFSENSISYDSIVRDGFMSVLLGDKCITFSTTSGDPISITDIQGADSDDSIHRFQLFDSKQRTTTCVNNDDGVSWPITRVNLNRVLTSDVATSGIVLDICKRAGLDDADVDTSELGSDFISGYTITRQGAAKSQLTPVLQASISDAVESGDKLKFVKRGKPPVASVSKSDMLLADNTFQEKRIDEKALPASVDVVYIDKDNSYEQDTQRDKRADETHTSKSVSTISLAVAMGADTARQIAQKSMSSAWQERTEVAFGLSQEFLWLDPSDNVTVDLEDGNTKEIRLDTADIGADFTIESRGVETASTYDSSITGNSQLGVPTKEIRRIEQANLLLNDIPLIRDDDDQGGIITNYAYMSGFGGDNFRGGNLYKSTTGGVFNIIQEMRGEATWGQTLNELGDVDSPWVFDNENEIVVRVETGAERVESVTKLDVLNGANACIVGREIVQFTDAVDNGDDTFTLTGLLRGRRGTELETGKHSVGDDFILINTDTTFKVVNPLEDFNVERVYRGVGFGILLEDSDIVPLVNEARSLKPYAPSHFRATMNSGDADLSWLRRTRVGGAWIDGVGTVPVSETVNEFEIDVVSPAGEILRTIKTDTESYKYTSTMKNEDFGPGPLTEIRMVLYQISGYIGRGFAKDVTLDVDFL